MLVTNEIYGSSTRLLEDDVEGTEMAGVEHLGQYVYEMTRAKLEASRAVGLPLAIKGPNDVRMEGEEEEDDEEGEESRNGEVAGPEPEELDEIT